MSDDAAQGEIIKPTAFISERHRNPAEMMARQQGGGSAWALVCAILATLIFVVMLAVLWFDWTAIQAA
jgi:hypothetical protein